MKRVASWVTILTSLAFQVCVAVSAAPPPVRTVGSPLVVLTGNDSHVKQLKYDRIVSAADWKKTWLGHSGKQEDTIYRPALEIDFNRCCVVTVFNGESMNTCGFRIESVYDLGDATVVRFDRITYQTAGPNGGGDHVTPYAFIVLPKTDKTIVLQENVQSYLGEPPEWKEVARLSAKKK